MWTPLSLGSKFSLVVLANTCHTVSNRIDMAPSHPVVSFYIFNRWLWTLLSGNRDNVTSRNKVKIRFFIRLFDDLTIMFRKTTRKFQRFWKAKWNWLIVTHFYSVLYFLVSHFLHNNNIGKLKLSQIMLFLIAEKLNVIIFNYPWNGLW